MCEMILAPKQTSAESLNSHDGEEVAIFTKGQIELILEHEKFLLDKGDSVRIKRGSPDRWENPTGQMEGALSYFL